MLRLKDEGLTPERMQAVLESIEICPTLTAHPTWLLIRSAETRPGHDPAAAIAAFDAATGPNAGGQGEWLITNGG